MSSSFVELFLRLFSSLSYNEWKESTILVDRMLITEKCFTINRNPQVTDLEKKSCSRTLKRTLKIASYCTSKDVLTPVDNLYSAAKLVIPIPSWWSSCNLIDISANHANSMSSKINELNVVYKQFPLVLSYYFVQMRTFLRRSLIAVITMDILYRIVNMANEISHCLLEFNWLKIFCDRRWPLKNSFEITNIFTLLIFLFFLELHYYFTFWKFWSYSSNCNPYRLYLHYPETHPGPCQTSLKWIFLRK